MLGRKPRLVPLLENSKTHRIYFEKLSYFTERNVSTTKTTIIAACQMVTGRCQSVGSLTHYKN
jgi:hypothetical protein